MIWFYSVKSLKEKKYIYILVNAFCLIHSISCIDVVVQNL
jgi:hypothetical protein